MKNKIAILGSTGSIGKTLLNLVEKDKKKIEIVLLTAHSNYLVLLKQAKKFKVKNLIITNQKSYEILIRKNKYLDINIYNNFECLNKIFKKKIDYTMSSIVGISGLVPTLKIIKHTKTIAIANKESIICGFHLLKKEFLKYKTKFIPVDSEHFSIWYSLKGNDYSDVEKILITASGGPFKNLPLSKFKNIKLYQALKHPTWRMGKKISIDSATMMNKVFEVIEAKKIFNIKYKEISILLHHDSYVHALVKLKNGMIKVIAHDTSMKIPIFNTLYNDNQKIIVSKKINIDKLNNLNFKNIDIKKYPSVKILSLMPKNDSLFETVIVSINDQLVELFLEEKIQYTSISKTLLKLLKLKEFTRYKEIKPKNAVQIIKLSNYVRSKVKLLVV